ncbi:MAG: hypothetical protein LAT57_03270 [Balneolales bacterium]|nr:hypothetical protein [Balneolales bacterium]
MSKLFAQKYGGFVGPVRTSDSLDFAIHCQVFMLESLEMIRHFQFPDRNND